MDFFYILLPFVAWVFAGSLKFAVNFFRFKGEAFARIGNGGFPSTHTTVVSSVAAYIGFRSGFSSQIFLLAETVLLITIIDALGIRRALGKHAEVLNGLTQQPKKLRESQGHNVVEVLGALVLGTVIGYIEFFTGVK
jgi:acid phosphatase family membrane protein YuiD